MAMNSLSYLPELGILRLCLYKLSVLLANDVAADFLKTADELFQLIVDCEDEPLPLAHEVAHDFYVSKSSLSLCFGYMYISVTCSVDCG